MSTRDTKKLLQDLTAIIEVENFIGKLILLDIG